MHDYSIIKDIVLILLLSIPVIVIFNKMQLPSIVGFLIAGIILGPSALKIISNPDQIEIMAEIGVILLMFSIGLEMITFSDIWMVSFLGVFQIAIAYAFFASGLKRVIAVEASIISMVEPVLNPVWVLLGYGEIPSITAIIGGVIILGAIIVRSLVTGAPVLKRKFDF